MRSKSKEAAAILLAYVSKTDYGFIAITGKLIPINDRVVINFFNTNLIILPWFFFFSLLINFNPPFSVLTSQSL